jgi:hypothetical protein
MSYCVWCGHKFSGYYCEKCLEKSGKPTKEDDKMSESKVHGTSVHVLPDESLGGVLREFVEVDRKAEVGDYVVFKSDGNRIAKVVTEKDNVINIAKETFEITAVLFGTTLEPTDIVHIDGVRYRLVDRKAKVGEKVIVFDHSNENGNGIFEVYNVYIVNNAISYVGKDGRHYGTSDKNYRVLEPLDSAEPEPIEVDTRHASPQVVDMLANLAQRIVELERKINDISVTLERYEHVNDRQNNEIDVLHANQRKLAEDTTNRLDRHSERIRELAEMIGERSDKVFNFPIKPFKFSDLNGKTLRIYSAQDVTDKSTTTVTVGIDIHDGNMYVLEVKHK